MEQVRLHDAPVNIFHGYQHIAVGEESLTGLKYLGLAGSGHFHLSCADEVQLQRFMPVPWYGGLLEINMMIGIGIFVVQTLNLFHLIAMNAKLHE